MVSPRRNPGSREGRQGDGELHREGLYRVVTPDECLALAEEMGPMGTITLYPQVCGFPVDLSWECLELFRTDVLPRLRSRS